MKGMIKQNLRFAYIMALLATACSPTIDKQQWENEIFPEMRDHKACLVAIDLLDEYDVEQNINFWDSDGYQHIIDAMEYVIDYVTDSLDSYCDARHIYDILSQKDKDGTLYVENKDDLEEQFAGAFFSTLLGIDAYDNFRKEYVLKIAKYFQDQVLKQSIVLDTPQFVSKTKDRIIYHVYSPTFNETYTLSCDRNGSSYYWDLTPIE